MIASIKGKLQYKSIQQIIVEVGGVGFSVKVPFSTFQVLPAINQDVSLYINTHVTDGSINLYGFLGEGEKEAFEKLISISKVGPKTALAVLSGLSIKDLKNAIVNRDINKLSSVQGVGKKMAERVILELADKKDFLSDLKDITLEYDRSIEMVLEDVEAALTKLGYSERQIKLTIRRVLDAGVSEPTVELIIKEALKLL
ncbi:Holliday junction branch migration protein RuvA [bacterium]|nr:Holliday junction branch migration protein RuvA [bacterium]